MPGHSFTFTGVRKSGFISDRPQSSRMELLRSFISWATPATPTHRSFPAYVTHAFHLPEAIRLLTSRQRA